VDQEIVNLLNNAKVVESLENHPGWPLILQKLDEMLAHSTNELHKVKPTDVDGVLAAHRDWKAVSEVRQTLLDWMADLKKTAAAITEQQKEQLQ
jgi:transposase-like protein